MEYIIDTINDEINFAPSPVEEVLQNIKYILLTTINSVPLDRKFGIDGSFVDKPTEIAKAFYSAEIYKKVHQYEPRCTIKEIIYTERDKEYTGRLSPKIKVVINGV